MDGRFLVDKPIVLGVSLLCALGLVVAYFWDDDNEDVAEDRRESYVRGLVNLGNTCFISVVLQGLANSTSFRVYLSNALQHNHSVGRSTPLASCLNSILTELASLSPVPVRPLNPLPLLKCLFNSPVAGTRMHHFLSDQHDAHEFLQLLLEAVDNELRHTAPLVPTELSELEPVSLRIKDAIVEGSSSPTPFEQLPGRNLIQRGACFPPPKESMPQQRASHPLCGRLTSTVWCERCERPPVSHVERFIHLGLLLIPRHVPDKGASAGTDATLCSVEDSLRAMMEREAVPGECDKCTARGNKGRAHLVKRVQIAKEPHVLCLHLQRSQYVVRDGQVGYIKEGRHVAFPSELSLKEYLHFRDGKTTEVADRGEEGRAGGSTFRLSAVVCHHGATIDSGHYTVLRRLRKSWSAMDLPGANLDVPVWVHISDHAMRIVAEHTVLSTVATLLFYERLDT